MIRLLPALLLTGLLAACGQKGALYLPPAQPTATPSVPAAASTGAATRETGPAPAPASP